LAAESSPTVRHQKPTGRYPPFVRVRGRQPRQPSRYRTGRCKEGKQPERKRPTPSRSLTQTPIPEAVMAQPVQPNFTEPRILRRCIQTVEAVCVSNWRKIHIMRTNIIIDDALMAKAMNATGLRTKREAVELGLQTLVRLREQTDIRSLRGSLAWSGNLNDMRTDG
jgi:Arc/MetJ family transcription regulator